ncbi:PREDICTED: Werner Syndrome-like exonuclease isoform X2 [Wasmannia auropunctata]|uniref:Werner Syndrome-like exonuclease isoform X2 n=1 Tax=Wasmannia auropunctata TaxID=64793 RepID=UPI0005ED53EC|nr:PREDICTED: Werner Syndrome-like exonuclease isoform X2 [Wasmannia auropunctata]
MTTRAASLAKKEVSAGSTGLRRSPRNLPQHLKEKLEQPKSEREPDIKTLPPIVFKGRIQYADDFFNCAQICDNLLQEVTRNEKEIVPIGFDLEWPFSFQTGSGKTALVQICLEDSVCYLFDVWKLGRDFKEFPAQKVVENNCLDCGTYANRVLNRSCRWSLERLTAYLLKKKINKDPEVRMSKWHVQPLSNAQKNYAATDAYVSLLLYTTLEAKAAAVEKENQNNESSLNPSI